MFEILKRGFTLVASVVFALGAVVWQPNAAQATCSLGTGSFSDGGYATPGTWYYYDVDSGPPNAIGDLWVNRNNTSWVETPGWLRTDVNGDAHKGPWTPTSDEFAVAYIEWPNNNNCTTNEATHVNDV
ncbi:MAG TPA: hypothetical protein VFC19_31045 [Candidatus Limnocylindrales bacterium]|nr:hypothetical protein [Candidatus Limnocylindrales bacterium]